MKRASAAPLSGLRVVELCHHLVGPVSCMYLADFGAEVVKVEPLEGDARRHLEPTLGHGLSTQFLGLNRNKLSLALNLRSPAGRAVLERLLTSADVFVSNLSEGWLKKGKLDHAAMKRRHPRLIHMSLSAYGLQGPLVERRGFDVNLCGESGLWLEGLDGKPRSNASPFADTAGALAITLGVLLALVDRERNGQVASVQTDLLSICMSLMAHRAVWMDGVPAPDLSPTVRTTKVYDAIYTFYETSDGWVSIGAPSEPLARRLFRVLGFDALNRDARYATWAGILDDQARLRKKLAPAFKRKSTSAWCTLLSRHKIPVGSVNTGARVWAHPQLAAMNGIEHFTHPAVGGYRSLRAPLTYRGRRTKTVRGAPLLGQHSKEILRALRYTPKEVAKLLQEGVVQA